MRRFLIAITVTALAAGCASRRATPAGDGTVVTAPANANNTASSNNNGHDNSVPAPAPASGPDYPVPPPGGNPAAEPPGPGLAVATFAGGCFWCMEGPFERLPGVRSVVSGYTGGPEQHPTYEAVGNHQTGHTESIRVVYDPAVITYERLLDVFWRQIDPTTLDRMFADVGHQYRSAIFVHSPEQRAAAERSRAALAASRRFDAPIVTAIEDASTFWVAEAYHQDFYRTHAARYREYRTGSGREQFLREHWGAEAH